MDVSAEAADLVVKEGIQATESAVKLAGSALKNVAALLLALKRQDNKVVGQTNAKRLARDPAPAVVIPLKREDMGKLCECGFQSELRRPAQCRDGGHGLPHPRKGQGGRSAKKSGVPYSTREVLARAREWLDSLPDSKCGY